MKRIHFKLNPYRVLFAVVLLLCLLGAAALNVSWDAAVAYADETGPADIAQAEIVLSRYEYTYSGRANVPDVTVTCEGVYLIEGVDYTLAFTGNTDAGTAKVTVTGQSAWTGTAEATFTILKKDISGAAIVLKQDSFDYTGFPVLPEIQSVTLDGEKPGYTVSYVDNTEVGTGRVVLTGSGNYTGTAEAAFTIRSVRRAAEPDTGEMAEWAPYSRTSLNGGVCHVYLTQDVSLVSSQSGFSNYTTLYLDMNGHAFSLKYFASVGNGMRLVLCDTAGGGVIQPQAGDTDGCGVYVTGGGTFDMYGGTIRGYTAATSYGNNGAVYLGEGGTFNMYGGALKENLKGGEQSGGAVYNYRGDVRIAGGEISGNTGYSGGAIYSNRGNLVITGGTIQGNTAGDCGGAVYYEKNQTSTPGTFEMTGGAISGNRAANQGGGVYAYYCTFDMSGGTILGNSVTSTSSYGAGIRNVSGTVNLSGTAVVSGNYFAVPSTNNGTYLEGAGIFSNGTVNVSGNAQIVENRIGETGVYLTYPVRHQGAGIWNSGRLNISGGQICRNTGLSTDGAGIYNSGTMTLSGGEISGNQANASNSRQFGRGAGVYNEGTLTLSGGSIAGNTSATQGGAVYAVAGHAVQLSGDVEIRDNTSGSGGLAVGPEVPAVTGPLTGAIVNGTAGNGAVKVAVPGGGYALTQQDALAFESEDGKPGFLRGWDQCIYVGTEPRYTLTLEGAEKVDPSAGDTFLAGTEVALRALTGEGRILLDWLSSDAARPIEGAEEEVSVMIPDGDISVTARLLEDPALSPVTYTGEAQEPEFPVVVNGAAFEKDVDYTLAWADNTDAGTASVTITSTAEPVWSTTLSFEIRPIEITVSGNAVQVLYDGEQHTAEGFEATGLPEGWTLSGLHWSAFGTDAGIYENAFEGAAAVTDAQGEEVTRNCRIVCQSGSLTIVPRPLEGAEIWPLEEELVYTGAPIQPEILVMLGDVELTDADYTVSYADNTAAGEAEITIKGVGNYAGTATGSFTIARANLRNAVLTVAEGPHTYQAQPLQPEVTVSLGEVALTEGEDYSLIWSNNTAAGTATVRATGMGSCTGALSGSFVIEKLDILQALIATHPVTACGSPQTPAFEVTAEGASLTEGVDYRAEYADNTEAGTATLTIIGIGSCQGTCSASFEILPASMEDAEIALAESPVYTGAPVLPEVTVTIGEWTLAEGVDYALEASDNVDAGTATLTIAGLGSCVDSLSMTYEILPKPLTGAAILAESAVYTGGPVTVPVSVELDGVTLNEDSDFTASFAENTDVGLAQILVEGVGNYTGRAEGSFEILPASMEGAALTLSGGNAVYSGEAVTPVVLVRLNSKRLKENTDYTLDYADNINAGTARVIVTGMGNYAGTAEKTFTIRPADLSGAEATVQVSLTYNGAAQLPELQVVLEGTTLAAGQDYEIAAENNVDAGTASYTVSGIGNYEGSLEGSFAIAKRDLSSAVVTAEGWTLFTGGAATVPATVELDGVTLTEDIDYTLSYADHTAPGNARIHAEGRGNYTGTAEGTYAILDPEAMDTYRMPGGLKRIGEEAFVGAAAERIVVPEGCLEIESRAFAGCETLRVVQLPASLEILAEDAFEGAGDICIVAPEGSPAAIWAAEHGYRAILQ